jgi:hypothetical protein
VQLTAANQEWALDITHDVVAAGRTIRVLRAWSMPSLASAWRWKWNRLRKPAGDVRAG